MKKGNKDAYTISKDEDETKSYESPDDDKASYIVESDSEDEVHQPFPTFAPIPLSGTAGPFSPSSFDEPSSISLSPAGKADTVNPTLYPSQAPFDTETPTSTSIRPTALIPTKDPISANQAEDNKPPSAPLVIDRPKHPVSIGTIAWITLGACVLFLVGVVSSRRFLGVSREGMSEETSDEEE